MSRPRRRHGAARVNRGVRRGAAVALLGVGLGAPAPGAASDTMLCRASVSLDPPTAHVGEQVVYRLRIERRGDVRSLQWERNLSFPAFRAEWLPGVASGAGAGGSVQVFEERRALFPTRAGRLAIPAAGLRCRGDGVDESAPIPGAVLEVVEPPARERPAGWTGVVGAVEVRSSLAPRRLGLGGSTLLSVTVQGPANLWEVELDLAERLRSPELEVFERPPELARDAGRRLTLRRYFTYELVPRRAGVHAIPPVRIPFFDPGAQRYASASAAGLRLEVEPALPHESDAAAAEPAAARPEPAAAPRLAPLAAAALAALALAASALALARRARGRPAPAPAPALAAALAEAAAAERAGELERAASALARGVREALRARVPSARALSSEELAAAAPDEPARALARLLARLDDARFRGSSDAAELRALRRALEALAARGPETPSGGC